MFGCIGRNTFPGSLFAALVFIACSGDADAVPSFARQTGQECPACHVSWPELTPYGRYFKLTGYTIGKTFFSSEGFNYVPMAVMAQGSVTNIRNNTVTNPDTGETSSAIQRQNSMVFSGGSLFLASKINDYVGGFIQWSYDNLATRADGTLGGHSNIDNTDIRAVYKYSPLDAAIPTWIFGVTLNNNPTMQDPWNSTPAWAYPYTTSPLAITPAAATIIDGGLAQQVAGLGIYAYWEKTLYAEFSNYRTANVAGNILRAGLPYNTPGGVLTVNPIGDGETTSFRLMATGLNARLPQNIADILSGAHVGAVDAHAVQPYYTRLLAQACGLTVTLAVEAEGISITAS